MAGAWDHTILFPALYLVGKAQPWRVPQYLPDLCTAESAVADMGRNEILEQLLLLGPWQPNLRYVDHASARLVFEVTPAGTVLAHAFEFHLAN